MKNNFTHLLLLLSILLLTALSCHKEDPEPDLVPITTTGANTMGFYVDGVPHNKKGQSTWSNVYGVSATLFYSGVLYIFGGGGTQDFNFNLFTNR